MLVSIHGHDRFLQGLATFSRSTISLHLSNLILKLLDLIHLLSLLFHCARLETCSLNSLFLNLLLKLIHLDIVLLLLLFQLLVMVLLLGLYLGFFVSDDSFETLNVTF